MNARYLAIARRTWTTAEATGVHLTVTLIEQVPADELPNKRPRYMEGDVYRTIAVLRNENSPPALWAHNPASESHIVGYGKVPSDWVQIPADATRDGIATLVERLLSETEQ